MLFDTDRNSVKCTFTEISISIQISGLLQHRHLRARVSLVKIIILIERTSILL